MNEYPKKVVVIENGRLIRIVYTDLGPALTCQQCGEYTLSQNANYCSDKCLQRFHYLKRKESGYYANTDM